MKRLIARLSIFLATGIFALLIMSVVALAMWSAGVPVLHAGAFAVATSVGIGAAFAIDG